MEKGKESGSNEFVVAIEDSYLGNFV